MTSTQRVFLLARHSEEIPLSYPRLRYYDLPDPDQAIEVAPGVRVWLSGYGDFMMPSGKSKAGALITVWQTPAAEYLPGLGDRDTEVVWQLHRGKLDELAGRPVTNAEADRIANALEFSTIGETLELIIESVCGPRLDEDDIAAYETEYDIDDEDES